MYQRCPFCDRVFEIEATGYRPMRRHIRAHHSEPDDGGAIDDTRRDAPAPLATNAE